MGCCAVFVLSPRGSGTPPHPRWQPQDPLATSSLYLSIRAMPSKGKGNRSKFARVMGKEWSQHRPKHNKTSTLPNSVSETGMEAAIALLHTPPPATPAESHSSLPGAPLTQQRNPSQIQPTGGHPQRVTHPLPVPLSRPKLRGAPYKAT